MFRLLYVLGAIALLGLVGCERTLDTKKLETNIQDEIAKQTGTKPKSVTCPAEQKDRRGGTFDCTAEHPDGSKARVEVTMKGDGQVEWKLIPTKTAESAKLVPSAAPTGAAKPAQSGEPADDEEDEDDEDDEE
jgi:uncharacterized protein DUF4333